MSEEIKTITVKCPDCDKDFECKATRFFEVWITPRKYCDVCISKRLQVEKKNADIMLKNRIAGKRLEWRLGCGIPDRFINEEFGTFITDRPGNIKRTYEVCLKYARGFDVVKPQGYKSLVLISPGVWGIGKSHLVCGICHSILNKWEGQAISCPVMFVSEPRLFSRIRASYNRGFYNNGTQAETEDDIIKKTTGVKLLVLDDVGKEEVADPRFVQRILFSIIDGRYNNNLPIVITANKSASELKGYLGGDNEASFNRLVEMTGGSFIKVTGESYRNYIVRSRTEGSKNEGKV